MTAHTVIDPCQADVPEDIRDGTKNFAIRIAAITRHLNLSDILDDPDFQEACLKEDLRQHRREQIIRTKGVIHGAMAMQGLPPDPVQIDYQWDRDEAEYGQEWSRI